MVFSNNSATFLFIFLSLFFLSSFFSSLVLDERMTGKIETEKRGGRSSESCTSIVSLLECDLSG